MLLSRPWRTLELFKLVTFSGPQPHRFQDDETDDATLS